MENNNLTFGQSATSKAERFSTRFFEFLKKGLFGYLFTSYDKVNSKCVSSKSKKNTAKNARIRRSVAKVFEQNPVFNAVPKVTDFFLRTSSRDYGVLLLSMGLISAGLYPIKQFITHFNVSLPSFIVGIILLLCSIPFLCSSRSIASYFLNSKALSFLLFEFFAFKDDNIRSSSEKGVRSSPSTALIIGMILGFSSAFFSTFLTVGCILIVIFAYAILITPEAGIILALLTIPFVPPYIMIFLILYVTVCYFIKCTVGKRTFKFELFDICVFVFSFFVLLNGLISTDFIPSLKETAVDICFFLAFLITSNLIRSKEWHTRCLRVITFSSAAASLMLIVKYILSKTHDLWQSIDFFETLDESIVFSFSSNDSVGVYLAAVIPFVFTYMVCGKSLKKNIFSFASLALCVVALVFSNSRAGYIATIVSVLLLLMIYHKNFIYLTIGVLVAIPALYFTLPDAVVSKISTIGLPAGFHSHKLQMISSAKEIILKHPFGIGYGQPTFEKAFSEIGAQTDGASDFGNTFVQILCESGFLGFAICVIFILAFLQLVFTYCAKTKIGFRRISCLSGLCAVVSIIVAGGYCYVFADKNNLLLFVFAISLAFAYVKVDRENNDPFIEHIDIACASIDIAVPHNQYQDYVPKRKYVHGPHIKKQQKTIHKKQPKYLEDTNEFITILEGEMEKKTENDKSQN